MKSNIVTVFIIFFVNKNTRAQLIPQRIGNQYAPPNTSPVNSNVFPGRYNFPAFNKFLANNFPVVNHLSTPNTLANPNSVPFGNNFPNKLHFPTKFPENNGNVYGQIKSGEMFHHNNEPTSNFLAKNIPAINNFPVSTFLSNNIPHTNNNKGTTNNVLTNNFPNLNDLSVNNFLERHIPSNKFPVNHYLVNNSPSSTILPNNYLKNSFPEANNLIGGYLTPSNPMTNGNLYINNLLNKEFPLPNDIVTASINKASEISNSLVNAANYINSINFASNNNLQYDRFNVNNNLPIGNFVLNELAENNFKTDSIQKEPSIENIQLQSYLQNFNANNPNLQNNVLPDTIMGQNKYQSNAHISNTLCNDLPQEVIFNNVFGHQNNFPKFGNVPEIFPSTLNNCLQFNNLPSIEYQNNEYQRNTQTLIETATDDQPDVNMNSILHLENNGQNSEQFSSSQVHSLPVNDLFSKLLTSKFPDSNLEIDTWKFPEPKLPFGKLPIDNFAHLPYTHNLNSLLNKGSNELPNLPFWNGLPVIGITETFSFVNPTL